MNHALLLTPQHQASAARTVAQPQLLLRRTLAVASSSALTLVLFFGLASESRAQDWGSAANARPVSTGMATVAQPSANSSLVRVLSATPNLERVTETRQQCGYETQQVASGNASGVSSTGGAVLGALAGGLIASNVGKGTGKNVAIAAGSATGALIGKSLAEQSGPQYSSQTVQVCRPTSVVREQVRDYTVRYEYQGQEYLVTMPQQPGQWLRLNVSHSVTPV